MGADLRSAVSMSHLRELPPEVLDELLAGSTRMTVPAGSVTHWEGEPEPHLELVLAGVVRVFVTARDGRTMTVRYCRPGALIGVMSLFATGFAMPATTQALVDAEVLRISATVAWGMGTRDLRVARAFLGELSERALSFVHEIPGGAFATMRQRVARHLLDLASARVEERPAPDHRAARELTVQVSQQELANAVGTVREVVVRFLRDLRQDGVVRTERDRIVLLEPAQLASSAALTRRGVEHLVLERGRVGQSWREQRWDSLRVNNPGWMNPMLDEQAPDTYLTAGEVVERLDKLAAACPVREGVRVARLAPHGDRWTLLTSDGELRTRAVVVASGGENLPRLPRQARALSGRVAQYHAADYRNPGQLPDGAVLVVGSAQSGCQIAEDLLAGAGGSSWPPARSAAPPPATAGGTRWNGWSSAGSSSSGHRTWSTRRHPGRPAGRSPR